MHVTESVRHTRNSYGWLLLRRWEDGRRSWVYTPAFNHDLWSNYTFFKKESLIAYFFSTPKVSWLTHEKRKIKLYPLPQYPKLHIQLLLKYEKYENDRWKYEKSISNHNTLLKSQKSVLISGKDAPRLNTKAATYLK